VADVPQLLADATIEAPRRGADREPWSGTGEPV